LVTEAFLIYIIFKVGDGVGDLNQVFFYSAMGLREAKLYLLRVEVEAKVEKRFSLTCAFWI